MPVMLDDRVSLTFPAFETDEGCHNCPSRESRRIHVTEILKEVFMRGRNCRIALFKISLMAALLLAVSILVLAQSTAALQGTVTDSKGAVVPNATVVVRNKGTSFERTTQTDSDGNYQVAALPVGTYSVEVKVQGFKTKVVAQLAIEVARTVVQNFQLEVGDIAEQVVISSDAPIIETATTSVGTVINQRTVQDFRSMAGTSSILAS